MPPKNAQTATTSPSPPPDEGAEFGIGALVSIEEPRLILVAEDVAINRREIVEVRRTNERTTRLTTAAHSEYHVFDPHKVLWDELVGPCAELWARQRVDPGTSAESA